MKRMEPLNRDELLRLLRAAHESSTRDWCLLLVMYSHGLRASEAGRLLRNDLNEQDWTLNVKRLKGSQKTLQVIYPNGIKLLDERKALLEWLAERPAGGYLFRQSTRSAVEPNLGVPDLQEARCCRWPAGTQVGASCPEAFARSRPPR